MIAPLRRTEPVGLDELSDFGEEISGLTAVADADTPEVTPS
jgi:arsenite-transporting ATPase